MTTQTYQNHTQRVRGYTATGAVLALVFIGSCVNLYRSIGDHQRLYSAALMPVLTACVLVVGLYARVFALKAQDRAIRAEEALRNFVLTGRPLDSRLELRQIIALRFAGDDEFPALATQAAERSMPPEEIKKSIRYWRADTNRV